MTPTPTADSMAPLERDHLAGHNPLAYIPYAEALRQAHRLSEAHDVCQLSLEERGESVAGRLLLARILADMGKNEQAAAECELILRKVPQSQGARRLLISIALRSRRYLKVIQLIDEVEVVAADDPELLSALNEAQRALADGFVQWLRDSPVPRQAPRETMGRTFEEVLDQIERQRGIEVCEVVTDHTPDGPLAEMVRGWASILNSHHHLTMAIIEAASRTIFVRRLDETPRTLVVSLPAGTNIGPIKLLADRLSALASREEVLP